MSSFYRQKLDIFYYLCSMKSIDLISKALDDISDGMVFDYADLNLPAEYLLSAAQAISRMVKSGQLRKVGKGKFYKPKFSRLGEMPPQIDCLTKDLIFKDGKRIGYLTGVQAFAQMGLTTQISSKILIASNNYRRPLNRAGYNITYIKQENNITEDNIHLLRILDAIKLIKDIPAITPDGVVSQISKILQTLTSDQIEELGNYALKYPASTRALTGAIIENTLGKTTSLKATLNPFTKYNIGVSERVLPNKAAWNIL